MVDDKLRILAAIKAVWGDRLTTVFPRQGHYAFDTKEIAKYPPADITVERIGDLLGMTCPRFSARGRTKNRNIHRWHRFSTCVRNPAG